MAQYEVRVNEVTMFPLVDFDPRTFMGNPQLYIMSDDLASIKTAFKNIHKLEIFNREVEIVETTNYDTYSGIQYMGVTYSNSEEDFVECLAVSLSKTSLVEQVNRIEGELFPVIDFENMTTEEYRTWLLEDVSRKCNAEIYEGSFVEISTGLKKFSYTVEDQQNIQSAVAILLQVPELPALPYHADGEPCYLMPVSDFLAVYMTLHLRLTQLTTRCNYLNMWIRNTQSKEELMNISYESTLPTEYQEQVDSIMASAIDIVDALRSKYLPNSNAGENGEDTTLNNEDDETGGTGNENVEDPVVTEEGNE